MISPTVSVVAGEGRAAARSSSVTSPTSRPFWTTGTQGRPWAVMAPSVSARLAVGGTLTATGRMLSATRMLRPPFRDRQHGARRLVSDSPCRGGVGDDEVDRVARRRGHHLGGLVA